MAEIIPALLGADQISLGHRANQVADLVNYFHFDMADGEFASRPPGGQLQPENLDWLPESAKVEVHLMVAEPEAFMAHWLTLADRIIIHQEAAVDWENIFELGRRAAVKIALAVLLDTPLSQPPAYYEAFDLVQLMGIKTIGYQGQPFESKVVERVKSLRSHSPNVKISVDGGVNLENASALIHAGADQLVVGSGLWARADPRTVLQKLQTL